MFVSAPLCCSSSEHISFVQRCAPHDHAGLFWQTHTPLIQPVCGAMCAGSRTSQTTAIPTATLEVPHPIRKLFTENGVSSDNGEGERDFTDPRRICTERPPVDLPPRENVWWNRYRRVQGGKWEKEAWNPPQLCQHGSRRRGLLGCERCGVVETTITTHTLRIRVNDLGGSSTEYCGHSSSAPAS